MCKTEVPNIPPIAMDGCSYDFENMKVSEVITDMDKRIKELEAEIAVLKNNQR